MDVGDPLGNVEERMLAGEKVCPLGISEQTTSVTYATDAISKTFRLPLIRRHPQVLQ